MILKTMVKLVDENKSKYDQRLTAKTNTANISNINNFPRKEARGSEVDIPTCWTDKYVFD